MECMEKGKESSDNIYKREIDILSSGRLKLIDENRSLKDQLVSKTNTSSQIISETACPGKFILSERIPLESGLLLEQIPKTSSESEVLGGDKGLEKGIEI